MTFAADFGACYEVLIFCDGASECRRIVTIQLAIQSDSV
jgi:hypothetical protein